MRNSLLWVVARQFEASDQHEDLLDTYAPLVEPEELRRRGGVLRDGLEAIRRARLDVAVLYSSGCSWGSSSNSEASTAATASSSSSEPC